jgi:signal transduction histidine kinase
VPLSFQGRALGVICALDRIQGGPQFDHDDERLLTSFAGSASTAVATAQSVSHQRQRQRIRATEQERGRWARELHDETLQGLAARRVMLSSALQRGGGSELEQAVRDSIEQMTADIENLRGLISELRPAALDEIGLAAAIEGLAERVAATTGAEVHEDTSLEGGPDEAPLDPELQSTVYRVVQEALTNVAKHAQATRAEVKVTRNQAQLEIEISDDGTGFDVGTESAGFGVPGMKERVELVGGELQISSDNESGTQVRAVIPLDDSAQEGDLRPLADSA